MSKMSFTPRDSKWVLTTQRTQKLWVVCVLTHYCVCIVNWSILSHRWLNESCWQQDLVLRLTWVSSELWYWFSGDVACCPVGSQLMKICEFRPFIGLLTQKTSALRHYYVIDAVYDIHIDHFTVLLQKYINVNGGRFRYSSHVKCNLNVKTNWLMDKQMLYK